MPRTTFSNSSGAAACKVVPEVGLEHVELVYHVHRGVADGGALVVGAFTYILATDCLIRSKARRISSTLLAYDNLR